MTDDIRTPILSADSPSPACAAVDERLMDFLEGDLAAGDRAAVEAHLAACGRCAALVADLRALATAAAALPTLPPARDLWAGIASRIEAPGLSRAERGMVPLPARGEGVVPLHVQPTTRRAAPSARATVSVTHRWMAAAAVALMTVTAGATYLATRGADVAGTVATAAPTNQPTPDSAMPVPIATPTPDAPLAAAPTAPEPRSEAASPAGPARLAARRAAPVPGAGLPGVADYDRAIATLRTAVGERRADLDSGTVAVLERNLRIIDEAIRQSREALAADPASPLAGRALTKALDRKVELLRTVALLPRT
ncbi:MAG: zf-HC2 domain-containing protein [Gemmatirosa sp.]